MTDYGQFCPIARSSELLAERWTPILVRNLLNGCTTFSEIRQGAPGISTALLAQRLDKLERSGIVERTVRPSGRRVTYRLTEMGAALRPVLDAMGSGVPRGSRSSRATGTPPTSSGQPPSWSTPRVSLTAPPC